MSRTPSSARWCIVGFFVVFYCALNSVKAHVALVFPPARKYDLDFLDSSRTKAPCGMPKGNNQQLRQNARW